MKTGSTHPVGLLPPSRAFACKQAGIRVHTVVRTGDGFQGWQIPPQHVLSNLHPCLSANSAAVLGQILNGTAIPFKIRGNRHFYSIAIATKSNPDVFLSHRTNS